MPTAWAPGSKPIVFAEYGWLTKTFTAIATGHKQAQIEQLLPWNYKADV